MKRLLVLMPLVVCLGACGEESDVFDYQTYRVAAQDLRITIRQKGEIEARDPLSVVNPIEGRPILLSVVPEGTLVSKGDLLFEVDVAQQKDQILTQQIDVNNAQQALFNAEKQYEIQVAQNESDLKRAELDILFAELDIEQYNQGDLPQERERIEADITLAREELKRAEDTLKWSLELADRGYISNDKLESDKLAVKRREIDRDLNSKKLGVLDEYTSRKRKRELEENVAETRRELERVRARAEAAAAQKKADVENRRAQFDLETKKLDKVQFMLTNNRVYAERDGIVIYGREGRGRDSKPVEPGTQLREGQVVVMIPDMNSVLVDVDVHESSVHLVKLGQPVVITTDTGETLHGMIEAVSSIADSQSWYRNPDLKVYSTKVTVQNREQKLKPGMNCYAEIMVSHLENVLAVPVQCVRDNGEASFCWVRRDGKPVLTKIETGLYNQELIHVKSGLSAGDDVYLARPADAEDVPVAAAVKSTAPIDSDLPPVGTSQEANIGGDDAPGPERRRPGEEGGGRRGGRMNPEAMERFKNMTEEERKEFRDRMGRGGGRRGAGEGGRAVEPASDSGTGSGGAGGAPVNEPGSTERK